MYKTITPVSYTHLDVYKRQAYTRAKGKFRLSAGMLEPLEKSAVLNTGLEYYY